MMRVRMFPLRPAAVWCVALACAVPAGAFDGDGRPFATEPRVLAQASKTDPAAGLFEEARDALNRNNFRRATELFAQIHQRYPQSAYAGDAYYWRAFALYKQGGDGAYRGALEALETQKSKFPTASTRGDADALATRIRGLLAQGGDPQAAEDITKQAKKAGESSAYGSVDLETQLAALNALMQMNEEQAVPILKRILAKRDAKSTPLRERAVFILSQHPSDETVDIMVDVSQHDPDHGVREKAVWWLSQVPGERSFTALMNVLNTSQDPDLREKAVFALSQHASPQASKVLHDLAVDPKQDTELRAKAIFWIGQSPDSFTFLRDLYEKLDDVELKEKTIFAISQQSDTQNRDWLMQRAANTREAVELRKKALFWVGQDHNLSVDELRQLYARFPEREMKEQVIFVMSQRGGAEAADLLIDIIKKEKDPELRKKAVFWLGQTNDPRAAKVLEELINQ